MVWRLEEPIVLSELKRRLSPGRMRHTLAVAALTEQLAHRYGEDARRARWAGLLHDWAKEMRGSDLVAYARRHRLSVPDRSFVERCAPHLLHAYVSAHMVAHRYGIRNRDILLAIAHHTLGAINMSPLGKILYVADLASPDRRFAEASKVRSLALRALEPAFRAALKAKICYVIEHNQPLHPLTFTLWNHVRQV